MLVRMLIIIATAGCTAPGPDESPKDAEEEPVEEPIFDAPWEGLAATDEATGVFEAVVGDDLPGPGWFHTGERDMWGAEGAWVRRVQPTGASDEVVTVSLGGRSGGETLVLQMVVAVSAWTTGSIQVDGDAMTGVIFRVGESGTAPLAYLIAGELQLDAAGTGDGELVKGTFTDVSIAGVSP